LVVIANVTTDPRRTRFNLMGTKRAKPPRYRSAFGAVAVVASGTGALRSRNLAKIRKLTAVGFVPAGPEQTY
jgi:hypothetical protein